MTHVPCISCPFILELTHKQEAILQLTQAARMACTAQDNRSYTPSLVISKGMAPFLSCLLVPSNLIVGCLYTSRKHVSQPGQGFTQAQVC